MGEPVVAARLADGEPAVDLVVRPLARTRRYLDWGDELPSEQKLWAILECVQRGQPKKAEKDSLPPFHTQARQPGGASRHRPTISLRYCSIGQP